MAEASDIDIWRYACSSGRIVITKDEDFIHLATREPEKAGVI